MIILAKYNTALTLRFPLIKRGVVDFAVGADYTHSSGDVKISKDGGAAATATNAPAALVMGNGAIWTLDLTATELSAAEVVVTVIDAATKAVEDQSFVIHTYGNASARHPFDLGTALASQTVGTATAVTTVNGLAAGVVTAAAIATDAIDNDAIAANAVTEIQSGLATAAALTVVDDFLDTEIADIQARLPAALVGGRIDASVGAVAANAITAAAIATGAVDADAIATDAVTEIADGVLDRAVAEPSGVFTWPGSLRTIIQWLGATQRNKMTQTSTTTVLRNDADSTDLATSTVSDDSTTFTRGEWS